MSSRIEVTYQGDLQCSALHGRSGARLATDAAVEHGGQGRTFAPVDLVGAALGSCVLTLLGVVARRKGIAFEKARAEVEEEMTAELPRRIARLSLRLVLPASLDEKTRRLFESAAHRCPVGNSLHPDVRVEMTFAYE